jgi:adenylate cyclase
MPKSKLASIGVLGRKIGLGRAIGAALLVAFVALRAWDPLPLELVRLKTFDIYQWLVPRTTTSGATTVVDIDERSLRELGQWPWPRTLIAELVGRIADARAAAIAFDVLFTEPDRLSPRRLAEALTSLDGETRAKLAGQPDNEQVLASALGRARVVLGQAGHHAASDRPKMLPKTAFATLGGDPKSHLFHYPGLLHNLPELETAAAGRGLITIRADQDGTIRRVPAVMMAGEVMAPALSIELLRVATNTPTILLKRDQAGIRSIVVAGTEIATDSNGQLWIHFARLDLARFVSASDLLAGKVSPERLRGKLVFVGTSAVGLYDLRATPIDSVRPGVDIHAEIVENILTRSLLTRPHYAVGAEVCLAALVGVAMVILVPMLGALRVFLFGALISVGLAAASWYLFQQHRILIDVAFPLGSSLAIFFALTFVNYVREEAQRSRIRNAFAQYLSPELVEQLTREPHRLVLGGETREMTILFSDVLGFTTVAETYKSDPAGLTQLMNRLLTPLSNAIIERRGTIDKYMGDAIMAFWNAPLDDPDHAVHACGAALVMIERLDELNAERERDAVAAGAPYAPLRIGIGISTGLGIVGNMGSDLRFDYSVLGDTVNLASRFEGLTRVYGMPILVSAETARQAGPRFALLEIDSVRVKGKHEAERAYAVLGGAAHAADAQFAALRERFGRMLASYRRRDWSDAEACLTALRDHQGRFGLGTVLDHYAARIARFRAAPPPEDWDDSFDMESK